MDTPPPHHPPPCPAPGFQLIELLLVLMVLAVLLTLAWGPWQRLVTRLRVDTLRAELSGSLAMARSTALTQRRRVTVCGSADGMNCSQHWSQGWLVRTEDASWASAPPGKVVQTHDRPANGIRIQSSQHRPHVQFLPDGRNAGTNQSLVLCVDGREHSRVVINVSGRVRSERMRGVADC
ncbi:GspH/FimT family protein [Stenotrophomonas sp.]|uniref:GspH/FimT family protein n=1 Tax=Stenotrophomonas sp. TaxID=69392 RepID=UPI002D38D9B1|nr:GspH/FimT family pseudopilin [Stenotrophomonas sp.]HYQ24212.1 GspH/FimT family pseudopilin [Stenotrophomonas sp.]